MARRSGHRIVSAVAALGLGACIVPDTNLKVQGDAVNPGTVRLLQSIAMTEEATEACDAAAVELTACPLVPDPLPFGAIDPTAPLCVCPERDGNSLSFFDIYVEDPDLDDDGRPKDTIFGALLLDLPGSMVDPEDYVAYTSLFPPTVAAANVNLGFNSYSNALERPEPLVRRWTVGADTNGVDLCNDNSGTKLEPGLHSLRLIVTDRPWYREVDLDEEGFADEDKDGELVRVPIEEASIGVPDLPAGASYSVADYVFRCERDEDDDVEKKCNCVEEEL